MARHRVVLRGGTVLTMDPQLGNLPRGDVLIEDGVIAAVAPDLSVDEAETVDVTPDARQMTLKVRGGVQFHTGRELTSDDLAWNYNRLKDP